MIRVTNQYLEEVEWDELFRDVSKLDIAVAYARTWRTTHRGRLERATAAGARVRLFLPDPDDQATVSTLADRFNMDSARLQREIREAIGDFRSLAVGNGGSLEVYLRAGDVVFSCYRFDSHAVITLYSHGRKRRTQVPTFVVRGGELYDFVYSELEALRDQGRPVVGEEGE